MLIVQCDRCPMTTSDVQRNTVELRKGNHTQRSWDLCPRCYEAMSTFLTSTHTTEGKVFPA